MVLPDWRFKHCASSLAICRSGGTKNQKRAELGCRGMGRHRSQDRAADSDDEEQDINSYALEPCWLNRLSLPSRDHSKDRLQLRLIRSRLASEDVESWQRISMPGRALCGSSEVNHKLSFAGITGREFGSSSYLDRENTWFLPGHLRQCRTSTHVSQVLLCQMLL